MTDEDFLIYDATHGVAMLRQKGWVRYLAMERYDGGSGQEELNWQELWKRFFDALTIEERRNEQGQRNHVPKHYWQDMCEMYPREC